MNARRTTQTLTVVAVLACAGAARTPDAILGDLQVFDAGAPAPAAPDVGAVYFTLVNAGAEADTLIDLSTPQGTAVLHTVVTEGGLSRMQPVTTMPVPAGETVRLRPGGYHVMVSGLPRRWAVGDTLRVTLAFARAGTLELTVPVRTYTDVVRRLEQSEGY